MAPRSPESGMISKVCPAYSSYYSLPRSAHSLPLTLTLSFRNMKAAKLRATAQRSSKATVKEQSSRAPDRTKAPKSGLRAEIGKKAEGVNLDPALDHKVLWITRAVAVMIRMGN